MSISMNPEEEMDYFPEDRCDHEEYEADICTGRATCCRCGASWYQTVTQIVASEAYRREYEAYIRRISSPPFRFMEWLRGIFARKRLDDEIPF